MEDPEHEEPEEPVRKYYTDSTKRDTSTQDTDDDGTPRVPVITDGLYAVLLQKHNKEYERWETKQTLYDENRARAYRLFLQHCPKPLKTELKQLKDWATVSKGQDAVGLL